MAVYTRINHNDLSLIEKNFKIGKIHSFSGIKKGIENTNYLIKTNKKKIILPKKYAIAHSLITHWQKS